MIKISKLLEKGWDSKEIKQTEKIVNHIDNASLHLAKIVFWSALLLIVFTNLLNSIILIPILIVLENWTLYIIITILALITGFIYNFLIKDFGYLEKKHHLLAGLLIPLITLSNIFLMVTLSNKLIINLKMNVSKHNPWTITIIFVSVFILPYVVDKILIMKNKKAIIVN